MSIRVIIPDSHGCLVDRKAWLAFVKDLRSLDPDEIVMLGDHVDAGGLYSKFSRIAEEDLKYSYDEDLEAANSHLDDIQAAAPRAKVDYLEGNHEYHVERWAVEHLAHERDVRRFLKSNGPAAQLNLEGRGIKFWRMMEPHHGLSIPGTIRKGSCYFTHGITASKFATERHVARFGANVVHGHTHRAQEHKMRTVAKGVIGGWCPGTLAQLQPTYMHTNPTDWSHGYGLQFVGKSSFLHVNVPIVDGESLLLPLTSTLHRSSRKVKA